MAPHPGLPIGRGTRAYNRSWRAASRFYGAKGQPPPLLEVGKNNRDHLARVGANNEGIKTVYLNPRVLKRLGSKDKRTRSVARMTVLHEWAHVFQRPDVYTGEYAPQQSNESKTEGAAEAHARWLAHKRFKTPKAWYKSPDVDARIQRRRHPWRYFRRGQFGENWGANPRTIRHIDSGITLS